MKTILRKLFEDEDVRDWLIARDPDENRSISKENLDNCLVYHCYSSLSHAQYEMKDYHNVSDNLFVANRVCRSFILGSITGDSIPSVFRRSTGPVTPVSRRFAVDLNDPLSFVQFAWFDDGSFMVASTKFCEYGPLKAEVMWLDHAPEREERTTKVLFRSTIDAFYEQLGGNQTKTAQPSETSSDTVFPGKLPDSMNGWNALVSRFRNIPIGSGKVRVRNYGEGGRDLVADYEVMRGYNFKISSASAHRAQMQILRFLGVSSPFVGSAKSSPPAQKRSNSILTVCNREKSSNHSHSARSTSETAEESRSNSDTLMLGMPQKDQLLEISQMQEVEYLPVQSSKADNFLDLPPRSTIFQSNIVADDIPESEINIFAEEREKLNGLIGAVREGSTRLTSADDLARDTEGFPILDIRPNTGPANWSDSNIARDSTVTLHTASYQKADVPNSESVEPAKPTTVLPRMKRYANDLLPESSSLEFGDSRMVDFPDPFSLSEGTRSGRQIENYTRAASGSFNPTTNSFNSDLIRPSKQFKLDDNLAPLFPSSERPLRPDPFMHSMPFPIPTLPSEWSGPLPAAAQTRGIQAKNGLDYTGAQINRNSHVYSNGAPSWEIPPSSGMSMSPALALSERVSTGAELRDHSLLYEENRLGNSALHLRSANAVQIPDPLPRHSFNGANMSVGSFAGGFGTVNTLDSREQGFSPSVTRNEHHDPPTKSVFATGEQSELVNNLCTKRGTGSKQGGKMKISTKDFEQAGNDVPDANAAGENENSQKTESFICSFCGSNFNAKSNMTRHIRMVHEGRKPHECSECGDSFVQTSGLKRHFTRFHADIADQLIHKLQSSRKRAE
eukprot:CAMPEP_0182441262 /NCGR_PEP_ID=MMETSP1172-20130603/208_1 /TAXON_ID=708627 /ORGANISM="Timspurckia oligopyrenoides, Strain CCMP3278" /LENGTH=843 /DNA_ID=CAMNT_0024635441 /DNA_START=90 /DNA_END=2624 /DNA_ORIENTATION=-